MMVPDAKRSKHWLRPWARALSLCVLTYMSVRYWQYINVRQNSTHATGNSQESVEPLTCTTFIRASSYLGGCFNPREQKRVISFAYFQSDVADKPRDCDRLGILHNLRLMRIVYPGWRMRLYISDNVKIPFVEYLENQPDVEIVRFTFESDAPSLGRTWRFLVAQDAGVDAFLVRDLDSRLNLRERYAVDAWLQSDKKVHAVFSLLYRTSPFTFDADLFVALRDHPQHSIPILAGMWGGRGAPIPDIKRQIQMHRHEYMFDEKQDDQRFLNGYLWDHAISGNVMAFDCNPHRMAGAMPVLDFPKPGRDPDQWAANETYRNNNFIGQVTDPVDATYDCDFDKERCWVIRMTESELLNWIDMHPVRWCDNTCRDSQ